MELVFHDVICSLTASLDFVGISDIHHGKRVALMAATMAKKLQWDEDTQLNMLYAGMLHDCGISSTEDHAHLVSELEWDDVNLHCELGQRYLVNCPLFSKYALWILHHHTHWNELEILDLPEQDKLAANLIFLVDRVDFLQAECAVVDKNVNNILLNESSIMTKIKTLRGTFFAPVLVDAFLELGQQESFWLSMDYSYIDASVRAYESLSKRKIANFPTLLSIATLFSKVIDAKSPHTKEHSKYVAQLARFLAQKMGFSEEEQQHIELAGMLHDLGKLRVPDYILNKSTVLTQTEYAYIRRHSFDTMQILKTVFPNTKIAEWASHHHENLTGTGYPFHLKGSELDLGSRIMTVADVFQALVQKRPYRDALQLPAIKSIMNKMIINGELDQNVVSVLEQHYEYCYALAQSPESLKIERV